MLTLNNVATQDQYAEAVTLGPSATCEKVIYLVANASVLAQVASQRSDKTISPWGDEILLTPQAAEFQRCQGVRFRSAIAGTPAQVVAQLIEPGDVLPVGGTPFTQSLATTGAVSGGGSGGLTSIIDFTVSAPTNTLDSQTILGGPLPTTFKNLLCELEARSSIATANDNLLLRLNADSGANYDWQRNYGNSGAMVSLDGSGDTSIFCGFISGNVPAGEVSSHTFDIRDYLGITYGKTITGRFYCPIAAGSPNGFSGIIGGKWRTVGTPVSRLQILCGANNFLAGTRWQVYGY